MVFILQPLLNDVPLANLQLVPLIFRYVSRDNTSKQARSSATCERQAPSALAFKACISGHGGELLQQSECWMALGSPLFGSLQLRGRITAIQTTVDGPMDPQTCGGAFSSSCSNMATADCRFFGQMRSDRQSKSSSMVIQLRDSHLSQDRVWAGLYMTWDAAFYLSDLHKFKAHRSKISLHSPLLGMSNAPR